MEHPLHSHLRHGFVAMAILMDLIPVAPAFAQRRPQPRSECRALTPGRILRDVAAVDEGVVVLESGPEVHNGLLRWIFPPPLLVPADGPEDPSNGLRPEDIGSQRLLVTTTREHRWRPPASDSRFLWRPWPGGIHRDRAWVDLAGAGPVHSVARYPDGLTYVTNGRGIWVIGPEGFRRAIGLFIDPPVVGWPPGRFAAVRGGLVGLTSPPVRVDAVTGERRWLTGLSSDAVCETSDGILWGFAADSRELAALRTGAPIAATAIQDGSLACSEREAIVLREEDRQIIVTRAHLDGDTIVSRSHTLRSTAGPILGIVTYVSTHLVWWHQNSVCRLELATL